MVWRFYRRIHLCPGGIAADPSSSLPVTVLLLVLVVPLMVISAGGGRSGAAVLTAMDPVARSSSAPTLVLADPH